MTPCPPVICFVAVGVKPPRWCARYANGAGFLPMVFDGPSMEAVTARAATFWESECRKQESLGLTRAKNLARARERRTRVEETAHGV